MIATVENKDFKIRLDYSLPSRNATFNATLLKIVGMLLFFVYANNFDAVAITDHQTFRMRGNGMKIQLDKKLYAIVTDTLAFHKEKLKDIALRMEKKYDLKIEIQSEQLKEKRFSGTFTDETLQQALEALKLSYPLTYTISDKLVVIKERE